MEYGRNWDYECSPTRQGRGFYGGPPGSEDDQRRTGIYRDGDMCNKCRRDLPSAVPHLPPKANGGPADAGCTATVRGLRKCKRLDRRELFLKCLEHVVQYTNSSAHNRYMIILDGHRSHTTVDAVMYTMAHGIDLITIPHCTHKMHKMLDRVYFKSPKSAYNVSADSWMTSHHGKRISFYDMAGYFGIYVSQCAHTTYSDTFPSHVVRRRSGDMDGQ